ncbi:glycosyltransferase family 2 protein [Staphylococcus simulans]|uniref:glycosyltransferase family 2 protein n=1 Tax=Staphylococcus simulans TaxID=1286 RepID=UPI00399B3CA5
MQTTKKIHHRNESVGEQMFSFILPAYNAEKTISKTIESILSNNTSQELEVIVINDGSTDDTKKILEKYNHHQSIKVINQENRGVSAARNSGLNALDKSSQFTAFIDDSDTISENYIEAHLKIYEQYPELKLSVAPILLNKDNKLSSQSLNFKFENISGYVDIRQHSTSIQYHMGGTVFRSEVFTVQQHRFQEDLTFWEDALLINTVLLENLKYGLVDAAYYYYDRNNSNSLSHVAWAQESRYTAHLKNAYFPLIHLSETLYGEVLPYIQYLIARHYLGYVAEYNQKYIMEHKYINETFKLLSKQLFKHIKLSVIDVLECPIYCKIYLYQLKDVEMHLSSIRKQIKVLIQGYHFRNRTLQFTFSNEAVEIPGDSEIYINNTKAEIFSFYKRYILGEEIERDITVNKYDVQINPWHLFFGFTVQIKGEGYNYLIKSPSILKRLSMKLHRRK